MTIILRFQKASPLFVITRSPLVHYLADRIKAARDFLMQCFQKDPNLRVTARKLLRHPWITGCRRAERPVSRAPSNFSQAVEEVKQWNKALKSSESSLRASTGSESGPSSRYMGGTPAKGPLTLAKLRPGAEAFRKPELAGMSSSHSHAKPCWLCCV